MKLLSSYAPPELSKPCLVISTIFEDRLKETAITFVDAFTANEAIKKAFEQSEPFIAIKEHKTMESAAKFHVDLAKKLRNGCSTEEWEKNSKHYYKFYDKYYVKPK